MTELLRCGEREVGMLESMGRIAALLAVALVVAGCGRPATHPARVEPSGWQTVQADVTGVHRTSSPRTVLLDVLVPAGQDHCARDPRIGDHSEENGVVYANVVVDTSGPQVMGNCPTQAPDTVTLTAEQPIGMRPLMLNNTQNWEPDGPERYRLCDTALACDPPADHCADAWITTAVQDMDAPRHAWTEVERCGDERLVMTINFNTAQCGAEPRAGCEAPPDIFRYFFRFDAGWKTILRTRDAGCAPILAAVPDFPRHLCTGLPAVT